MDISKEELDNIKNTPIDDMLLKDKFILIQQTIGEDVVDYKSKWWLDTIYDEFISKKFNNIFYNGVNSYTTEIYIFDKDLKDVDTISYTSNTKTSTRHDSMLNCLVEFCKKIDICRAYMGNIK